MQQVLGNVAGFPGGQYPMGTDGKAPRTSLNAVLQEVHPPALGGYLQPNIGSSVSHNMRSLAPVLRDSTVCLVILSFMTLALLR